MKLTWKVFTRGMNSQQIEEYNVFNHGRFYHDMVNCLRDCRGIDEFKEELKRDILYYYGWKVEWETRICEPFPHITKEEFERLKKEDAPYRYMPNIECSKKVDVAQQIMMNYDHFIKYIWSNRDEVLKDEKENI